MDNSKSIQELIEKIEVDKELLATMPKNNEKNIEKYSKKINEIQQGYESQKNEILTILNKRYQVELLGLPFEKIQQIAIKKNLLIKGGEIDFDRTCFMIIDDFRKGRLGHLTFI